MAPIGRAAMTTRLLVVDDSPLIRRMLTDVLAADFDEVLQAQDGLEGVQVAERVAPTLVLLDFEMPRMNGIEACRAMRSLPALQDVPIVMLTSRDTSTDVQMAFEAGATDYLLKPFAPGQLRARLRTWLLRGQTV